MAGHRTLGNHLQHRSLSPIVHHAVVEQRVLQLQQQPRLTPRRERAEKR